MLSEFQSHCLAAAFIGELPAFALADGTVRRLGAAVDCVRVHATPSLAAAPVAGEEAFVTSGEDGRVCRTDSSGEALELGCVPRKWITSVGQCRGQLAYASGKTVWLQSSHGSRQLPQRRNVKGIAFTRDGARLAVAQQDSVSVYETAGEREPLELQWNDIHHAATFSPDGRFLVVASQNSFLHGWRLADGKHFRMHGYQGRVDGWAWSSNGTLLATTGAAAAIVWPFDGDDGPMARSAVEVGARPQGVVTAVDWRRDTLTLAIGHADGAVQVASAEDPAAARMLRAGGGAAITALAWNQRGDSIAFGSADGRCGLLGAGS